MNNPIIQPYPPRDRNEYDCQCARCGSSADYVHCDNCAGEGVDGHDCGEDCCMCMYPEDNMDCDTCDGHGGWYQCCSSRDWCKANPLEGREEIACGHIEWFVVDEQDEHRPESGI